MDEGNNAEMQQARQKAAQAQKRYDEDGGRTYQEYLRTRPAEKGTARAMDGDWTFIEVEAGTCWRINHNGKIAGAVFYINGTIQLFSSSADNKDVVMGDSAGPVDIMALFMAYAKSQGLTV